MRAIPMGAVTRTTSAADAKLVSLSVRPFQASHLSFEVGGLLGELNVELGSPVAVFDFASFYAILGSMPTIPNDLGRLLYDFLEIQAVVKPFTLAALRAEPNKAALRKAVNTRANAFYAKYANAPAIIAKMNEFYSPSVTGSKPNWLDNLDQNAQTQFVKLRDAYFNDDRTEVIKTTQSVLKSSLRSKGSSDTTDQSIQESAQFTIDKVKFPPPDPGTGVTFSSPHNVVREDFEEGKSFQSTTSKGSAKEHQTIVNTDYGYRIPYFENFAQFYRAKISLIDERFGQFMAGQNLPFLEEVFLNELNSIDSDVYRSQIAYLNTILMSPISGTVTGIYKNPGDAVRPGEPVIRVENSDIVYLVAALVFRGPISIGSSGTVTTALFDSSGSPTTISGSVVSVRGQQEDDHWEVVIKCNNLDGNGKPILPLNYQFDYDDTTVSIT